MLNENLKKKNLKKQKKYIGSYERGVVVGGGQTGRCTAPLNFTDFTFQIVYSRLYTRCLLLHIRVRNM